MTTDEKIRYGILAITASLSVATLVSSALGVPLTPLAESIGGGGVSSG